MPFGRTRSSDAYYQGRASPRCCLPCPLQRLKKAERVLFPHLRRPFASSAALERNPCSSMINAIYIRRNFSSTRHGATSRETPALDGACVEYLEYRTASAYTPASPQRMLATPSRRAPATKRASANSCLFQTSLESMLWVCCQAAKIG